MPSATQNAKIKSFAAPIRVKDVNGRKVFGFVFTTDQVDRDNEILTLDGWEFANFEANPIVLNAHNYRGIENVIGKAIPPMKRTDSGWECDIEFNDLPQGQMAQKLVEGGFIRTVSVGFKPIEIDKTEQPYKHTKKELLEISLVPVPSNRGAVRVRSAEDQIDEEEILDIAERIGQILGIKAKLVTKAPDFTEIYEAMMAMEALREEKWHLRSAMSAAIDMACHAEDMESEAKVSLIGDIFDQAKVKYQDWAGRYFAAEAALPEGVDRFLSAERNAETKGWTWSAYSAGLEDLEIRAGAALSQGTEAEMQTACNEIDGGSKRIKKLMAAPMPPKAADPVFLVTNAHGKSTGAHFVHQADAEAFAAKRVNDEPGNSPYTVLRMGVDVGDVAILAEFSHHEKSANGVLRTDLASGKVTAATEAPPTAPAEISPPDVRGADLEGIVSALNGALVKGGN